MTGQLIPCQCPKTLAIEQTTNRLPPLLGRPCMIMVVITHPQAVPIHLALVNLIYRAVGRLTRATILVGLAATDQKLLNSQDTVACSGRNNHLRADHQDLHRFSHQLELLLPLWLIRGTLSLHHPRAQEYRFLRVPVQSLCLPSGRLVDAPSPSPKNRHTTRLCVVAYTIHITRHRHHDLISAVTPFQMHTKGRHPCSPCRARESYQTRSRATRLTWALLLQAMRRRLCRRHLPTRLDCQGSLVKALRGLPTADLMARYIVTDQRLLALRMRDRISIASYSQLQFQPIELGRISQN